MEFDLKYRDYLMQEASTEEGLARLFEEAKKIDPEAMETISKNDKKRITRVLEIYRATRKN
jgi:tRNA A37 N6-isopentenylltransferase MiaA